MKSIALFLLSLVLSVGASAQESIQWMSWDEAVAANQEEPKFIFVDTYTSWCGWCKKMDQSTFKNEVITKVLNDSYYAVKMDAEMKDTIEFGGHQFVNANPERKRSPHQLAASLLDNKMSYPSFVILNPEFQRLQVIPGYHGARDFEPILRYFVEGATKGVKYEDYLAEFESMFPEPKAAN